MVNKFGQNCSGLDKPFSISGMKSGIWSTQAVDMSSGDFNYDLSSNSADFIVFEMDVIIKSRLKELTSEVLLIGNS